MLQKIRSKCFLVVLNYCLISVYVEGHDKINEVSNVLGDHASKQIEKLFQDYFEWKWRLDPESASIQGLYDLIHGDEINDMRLNSIQNIRLQCQRFNNEAQQILDKYKINRRTKHFLNILKYETKTCVKGFKQKGYLLPPVSFMNGVHITLTRLFKPKNMRLESLEDYEKAVIRLKNIPEQIDQVILLLKKGIAARKTYANESIFRTKEQFERLQVRPEASDFYEIFKGMQQKLPNADTPSIKYVQSDARKVIRTYVLPSFKKLQNYLHGTYSKHLRPKPGISTISNGQQYYERCLKYHTTLSDISPEEIHNIGLNEVQDLRQKMREVAVKLEFPESISFSDFVTAMQDDPKQSFASQKETLSYFVSLLAKINPRLNQTFRDDELREIDQLDVKPIPPGRGGLAYYEPPSIDGKRKGAFYVNLENIKALKRFELMALTLHEGNPGHHLQLTQLLNNDYLPFFLKLPLQLWSVPSSFPRYTAFVEGWALYAEYLGNELGLYDDPNDMVSFLSWNLLRASRLVVDTGIHAFDWSREQAVDYLVSNTALSRYSCEAQVDRYISLPGQATAYKIGEKKIRQLREHQEETLGDKFDVQQFHTNILNCMGPLELLEECLNIEQSDTQPKKFYGKVPKISRKSKYLYSSSKSLTSSISVIAISVLTAIKIY